ncbi:MAG: prepilin-type N-terminal cleavage/methylation domain-containing protein, partial [Bacteroidales bacterium]|nr:prepilin-type N-terminal cleavage/methylation domain-containing protein [Bacteroidales bacterium]
CESRGSTLNGFSLIELMVAVVILSMAIFGIFNAFNSGWMGMADSRDRTVATNYAQEILEDIKNTLFEKIHPESTSQIGDTKFYRSISLNPIINPNIKEITAQVTWTNWRGSVKNVEASTLIYSQISSEPTSEAVALTLYAEPYYNVLPGSSSTMLTALVKDINGNLVTDWDEPIYFSIPVTPIDYSGMGTVPTGPITPVYGKATVFFASSGAFGEVVIVASSDGLTSDSVTLIVTDAAVAIKLEANPATISTGEHSDINVSLLDASYVIPPAIIEEHLITLYVKEGPGTITPISVLLNKDNGGISSTILTSSGTPGIVTIVASSIDLESGLVNVPILGSATSISIAANPSSINLGEDEDADITITIKDSAGNSVLYSGSINLSLSISNGSLSGEDYVGGVLTFLDESSKTITYAPSDAGEVNITAASSTLPGEPSDTVTVYISEGRKISLTAEPESIIADGNDPSTITATIKDMDGVIITGEVYDIVFEILSGYGYLSELIKTTENGVATTSLTSTSELDVITVIARGMDLISDSVTVETTIPKFISISADRDWLYVGEEAVISIEVEDGVGNLVDYSGNINLALSGFGSGNFTPASPLYYPGVVTTTVFTASSTGEVTITAEGEGINSDSITIQILEKITFADSIYILDSGTTITFDIIVGGVALEIEQMNITWDSPSMLNKICFSTPGTCFSYEPPVGPGYSINVEPTTLPSGVSTISLYFNGIMTGRTITVIFYDSDLVPYPLEEFTIQ